MQKEENLQCEKGEKPKIRDKNQNKKPSTKSKNRKHKAVDETTKRIKDYFPTVPKSNKERQEDNGVGSKDETRVTDFTTPDKSGNENGINHAPETNKGKQIGLTHSTQATGVTSDISSGLHC